MSRMTRIWAWWHRRSPTEVYVHQASRRMTLTMRRIQSGRYRTTADIYWSALNDGLSLTR